MRLAVCVSALLGLVTACETTITPKTGETSTRVTLPGTDANEASFQERWRRCTQFSSESVCERRFGGRRPRPSTATAPSAGEQQPDADGHP